MPVDLVRTPLPDLPSRQEIDMMDVKQLILLLRRTPNPEHGSKAHSFTQIAHIAKSSLAWPSVTLGAKTKTANLRGSQYAAPLRRYIHKLLEERADAVKLLRDPVEVPMPKRRAMPPKPRPVDPEFEKFMLAFDQQRGLLWDRAVALDELAKRAPAVFKPAFATVSETLLGLCAQLDVPQSSQPQASASA